MKFNWIINSHRVVVLYAFSSLLLLGVAFKCYGNEQNPQADSCSSGNEKSSQEDAQIKPMEPSSSIDPEEMKIIKLLQEMPCWEGFSPYEEHPKEFAKIEATVNRLALCDLEKIRDVLMYCYAQKTPSQTAKEYRIDGRVYKSLLLNKFLFQLPTKIRRDSPHSIYILWGYWEPSVLGEPDAYKDSDEADALWPWSKDSNGKLHLTGKFCGYAGEMYRGDIVFDYYRKHYGKRKMPIRKKRGKCPLGKKKTKGRTKRPDCFLENR